MQSTLLILAITFLALTVVMLIVTAILFFVFNIPTLVKDSSGKLEQKHVEEIRKKNFASAQQKGKVNVFEELEKKAKVKNTGNLHAASEKFASPAVNSANDAGTSVLTTPVNRNKDFIIEKNIIFVSTYEVI